MLEFPAPIEGSSEGTEAGLFLSARHDSDEGQGRLHKAGSKGQMASELDPQEPGRADPPV